MAVSFIWDLDGTLLDSYGVIVPSVCEMLAEKGISSDPEEVRRFVIARSVKEYLQLLGREYGFDYAPAKERYSAITEKHNADIRLMEGARETLQALSEKGVRHFVLTHRGRTTEAVLRTVGLEGVFEETVTSLNGFARKPDPEGLNYLIGKYGLDRAETYYVGDRPLDIDCAANALVHSVLYEPDESLGLASGKEEYVVRRLTDIVGLV